MVDSQKKPWVRISSSMMQQKVSGYVSRQTYTKEYCTYIGPTLGHGGDLLIQFREEPASTLGQELIVALGSGSLGRSNEDKSSNGSKGEDAHDFKLRLAELFCDKRVGGEKARGMSGKWFGLHWVQWLEETFPFSNPRNRRRYACHCSGLKLSKKERILTRKSNETREKKKKKKDYNPI